MVGAASVGSVLLYVPCMKLHKFPVWCMQTASSGIGKGCHGDPSMMISCSLVVVGWKKGSEAI